MGRIVIASVAAVSLLASTANAAAADRIASEVSIQPSSRGEVFRGRVSSDARACESNRRVVIKKAREGNDVPVGEARTNAHGHYRVALRIELTTYYAQVRGENRGANAVPCKGARSPKITFAQAEPARK